MLGCVHYLLLAIRRSTKLAYDLIWYESMYWYSEFLQYNIRRSLIVNSVWCFRIIYDLMLMPSLPKFIILELYIRLQFGFNRKTNMTIYTKLNWYLTIKYRTSRASTTHLMLWCIWLTTLWFILAHVQIIIQTMTEQKRHVMLLFNVDVGLCTYVH